MRMRLLVRASFELATFLVTLRLGGFSAMRSWVKNYPLKLPRGDDSILPTLTGAIDQVCMYSPVGTRCLARAAIGARLLRSRGFDANMVTGVQRLPFYAHAWVEVDGRPVYGGNDRVPDYMVIDRV
jgi:hypothetical protein